MTLAQKINKFLQTDNMTCANDAKPLKWGYRKLAMWPQYPLGSWKWLKQLLIGDTFVLRFCDDFCFKEFITRGKMEEIAE